MCKHSFVVDDGEYVCETCGIIGDRFIDESAEWIIQIAYKIEKEGGNGYYTVNKNTNNVITYYASTEN